MRPVEHAHRETYAELRVELGELVHAHVLVFTACTGAHVKRDAALMPGGAARYDATALFGFERARPAGAGALFALANAGLLVRCAVGRRDGHMAMLMLALSWVIENDCNRSFGTFCRMP